MKRFVKPLTLIIILAVTGSVAFAKLAKPDDAITYRKSVMQVIKTHFGSMGAMIKGQNDYDKPTFKKDATVVAMMATLPWEASMVPGSFSGNTRLKEKALEDKAGYMAAAKMFEDASRKLATIAEGGDEGASKAQFGATAKTCGGCHKAYRK